MITDFHSHILPGIDDGSRSVEMSVAMLQQMAQQGITRVVATPHFYAHKNTPARFLNNRNAAAQSLFRALETHEGLPQIILGAEVHYFPGISNSDALADLVIGDTNYILVEMHNSPWNESMYRELENIRIRQGLEPIIAHVDRYITPLRQHGIPQRLKSMELTVQANAEFFLNPFTRRMAMEMLGTGAIHLLGSDCHDLKQRAPNLEQAVEKIRQKLGDGPLRRIEQNETLILG